MNFRKRGCVTCGERIDGDCELVLYWKGRKEYRGSAYLCIVCWDKLQGVIVKGVWRE